MVWLARSMAVAAAGSGAYCFYQAGIVSYMFLKAQFVFFDFKKEIVTVFIEYAAIMVLWIFVGFYAAKGISAERTLWSRKFPD